MAHISYTFTVRGHIRVRDTDEGIAYGWTKTALEDLALTLPEHRQKDVLDFGIGSVDLYLEHNSDDGDFSTICLYCGHDGITVIQVTLIEGEIVLHPMVSLESDGFAFEPPDPNMKGTSTQDEVVRCNSCGREFGLDELMQSEVEGTA